MNLFTKTFFRFALGFIGAIMLSAAIIIVGSTLHEQKTSPGECTNCAGH